MFVAAGGDWHNDEFCSGDAATHTDGIGVGIAGGLFCVGITGDPPGGSLCGSRGINVGETVLATVAAGNA